MSRETNSSSANIHVVINQCIALQIDGSTRNLNNLKSKSLTLNSGKIKITQKGYQGFIETDFGVEIIFDWGEDLKVIVSSSYFDNLEGLCGNYNDDPSDDFSLPKGNIVSDLPKFAEAWGLPETNQSCMHACPGTCPNCPDETVYKQRQYCGEIVVKDGAFAACHAHISPLPLMADCIYNMCTHPDKEFLCTAMANYVRMCQQKGAEVSNQWLQSLNCCKYNFHQPIERKIGTELDFLLHLRQTSSVFEAKQEKQLQLSIGNSGMY